MNRLRTIIKPLKKVCSLVLFVHLAAKTYFTQTNFRFSVTVLIVCITKFKIVIGSPRAYLSRNRCVITFVPNCRYPILTTFCNWIHVILYLRYLHDNYLRSSGSFLRWLERIFRCYIVCETKEDYKEGCLMVWANYMSPCSSIVGLYFKGTCDVISVTMAIHKVHKSGL